MQPSPKTRTEVIVRWLVVFGIVLLALLFLANSMIKPVSRDEYMYCTAGVLTAEGKTVYRDFSYAAQPPYHAVLLAAFYKLSGTHRYLLVGRLVSVICDVIVVVFIVLIYWSIFGRFREAGSLFGLAAAVLCVFNPLMDYAAGFAWNHDAVMACVIASLWLFLRMAESQSANRYLRIGVIVVLLTLATCMRTTAVLIELVFLIAVLAGLGGSARQKLQTTAVFAGIAIVVAAWPIWLLMQAPRAVWLNLVQIPAIYGQWLHQVGLAHDKVAFTFHCLKTPAYLVLLASVGLATTLFLRRWSSLDKRTRAHFILMAVLPAVFILTAFIPPTMWEQYWGVPVPFLVTALAFPLAELSKTGLRRVAGTMASCGVAAAVIITVISNLDVLRQSLILVLPEQWTPVRLHAVAEEIAAQTKGPQRVLTLGPLYALEAGDEIYPELSCGDIIYRVADSLSAEERRITHTIGPAGLAQLMVDRPPSAILVGIEPSIFASLEEPLRRVIPPDWPSTDHRNGLRLYVRPGESTVNSPVRTRR
jgi:hypothetical protein